MATERLISAQPAADPKEEAVSFALRPTRLVDYQGQPALTQRLEIALAAAKGRSDPLEHVLLYGPPGLGKTTLAHILAAELDTHLTVTSGPALSRPTDLVGILTKLQARDVLFIDEVHRLPIALEEFLYSAMEDFKVDVQIDSGMHARSVTLPLQPFSLVGATTRAGLLSGPMRSRFGIAHNLEFYAVADLEKIIARSAALLGMAPLPPAALAALATRSRGTPRIANRLLRRVRDYAQVKAGGRVDLPLVNAALTLEGVDALGLDELDRKYLKCLGTTYQGGPVGLEALGATLGEDAGTLEQACEPYLLQIGFLARTRQWRMLTQAGAQFAGVRLPERDPSLFQA